jgi:hypothetical protein
MTRDDETEDAVASSVRNTDPMIRDVDNPAGREFRRL